MHLSHADKTNFLIHLPHADLQTILYLYNKKSFQDLNFPVFFGLQTNFLSIEKINSVFR